ncbi:MAG: GMC oxidoreductase [Pseudomonadota bacterium]
MTFNSSKYANFIAQATALQERLFLNYIGPRNDFDIIVVGSGIGGGMLADDLADRLGPTKRILVVEAGSFVYPTHVYNFCRFPNDSLAKHYGCDTFWQYGDSESQHFIGEKPQLAFGGRSIFWSGLIPTVQSWELDFFPPGVRQSLADELLEWAGDVMNESRSMGRKADEIVQHLQSSELAGDFVIEQTPRALHQPYLKADGAPRDRFFTEPTGVFNTAELLINQVGLTPGVYHGDHNGLFLLLNHYVEDVQNLGGHFQIVARDTLSQLPRFLTAGTVVLAAGSIESPKLLRRSSLFPDLPDHAKALVGRGLTDHPTSDKLEAFVTHVGGLDIPKNDHAKIVFYSKGDRDGAGEIKFPFNVEMNINHEYWHLRENDPSSAGPAGLPPPKLPGASRIDIKFSFGNCLDDSSEIRPAAPFEYVPEILFPNLSWTSHLAGSRFPALAGWQKNDQQIFAVMNSVAQRIFSQFGNDGRAAIPDNNVWYGQGGKGFGWGTVHHAAGSLRMPYRTSLNSAFNFHAVVDEDLRVAGTTNLYVCDMSVMPFSSAANPVRTLGALALRLSRHFG